MTLVIAHRGASAYAPENTLTAFELAVRQNADMIELDVQPTADGHLVVFHDDTTERWDGTPRAVAACSLAEMQKLNIRGERVPTLEETLVFAREAGITLNIELKQTRMGTRCAALLRRYAMADQVVASSFLPAALRELAIVMPELRRAYLMGTDTYRPDIRIRELWPFFALRRSAASAWHAYYKLPAIDRLLPLVRRAGYAVNVWTVDDPAEIRRMVGLGANGVITNRPDLARQVLRQN